ncbi:MAG: isoleucine--tRNA ligase [Clostridiales bacterium]|jgi:isoleucyl-tRNA synthetase|nr:isoleucine--tRNA ligase [Clostridiales bacterium]
MYKKVPPTMDFPAREREVLEFWNENDIFSESVKQREGRKEFSFYDGPPTANGKPHIGHILTRVMKDIIPRYKTMKGFHVLRKAGWDTHGLPVELEVEKQLCINGKQEIEKYGIEPFIKQCKESVWKYKAEWERMSARVGYWADMANPYVTYDDNYIESVWWSVKTIADKGLLYKGHKVVPYCPRCGTALSSHEVAQGYKDVKEKSIFVKFKVKNAADTYFLAWTTTPWTLPGNAALCVNPKEKYALIETPGGARYILAENLVPALFEEYKILETKKGAAYERAEYEPLFTYAAGVQGGGGGKNGRQSGDGAGGKSIDTDATTPPSNRAPDAWYVTTDNYVTLTDGSGIVHIAPAFGEDDANVGRRYGLPFIQLVNERGVFDETAGELAGKFAKDADKDIIIDLKKRGLLFREMPFEHSYPFCWRCDTPLLYYARASWFVKMSELRGQLLKNNAAVNWIPDGIGKGRMGNFLENAVDWGLSRERYWGTPLPVWVCPTCKKFEVIGSRAELKARAGLAGDVELHKPYVDAVTFKCECGGEMKRAPEVIDCWYDSGSMPFAQYHYPFENADTFNATFPADFISEAVDQTRGWFYTLLAIGTLLFDKAPFKNCIVLGHVNDKDGQKMSKHKGNVVDPWSVLDVQGADAVRWYFYTVSNPWLPSRFSAEAVGEAQRKFLGTLWNTYSFYVLYAEVDQFNPFRYDLKKCALTLMDRWILSGLNTLIQFVDGNLKAYKITESARAIQDFTDKLSNWYVRRSRERFWGGGMTEDKKAAFMTLFTVLYTLSQAAAPFIPFMSETIYQNIARGVNPDLPLSVHLCGFPKADKKAIDAELENGMNAALALAYLGRSARAAANVKNRQPLPLLMIGGGDSATLGADLRAIVADELNVKRIECRSDLSEYSGVELKPQLKTLGPKYGAYLPLIRAELESRAESVMAAVKGGGSYGFTAPDGTVIELNEGDLLVSVKNKEGYSADGDGVYKVVLDARLTDELIDEGYAREIVSKIQSMRKEAGFEVTDRITVEYAAGEKLSRVFATRPEIAADTLSDRIAAGKAADGFSKEWNVNGEFLKLAVSKIGNSG